MVKENFFSHKMTAKSDKELREIIHDRQGFVEDARLAAAWELEKRNQLLPEDQEMKESLVRHDINGEPEDFHYPVSYKAPAKIRMGVLLIYGSLFVGLINIAIGVNLNFKAYNYSISQGFGILLGVGIIVFLAYMASAGFNWARIVLLIIIIIGLIEFPFEVLRVSGEISIMARVNALQFLMQISAMILLFTEEANQWYKRMKQDH